MLREDLREDDGADAAAGDGDSRRDGEARASEVGAGDDRGWRPGEREADACHAAVGESEQWEAACGRGGGQADACDDGAAGGAGTCAIALD